MRLTQDQERILAGKEGEILQQAMAGLVKYGTAMGAEEFVPISSAHTFCKSPRLIAQEFPPRGVQLSDEHVAEFCQKLAQVRVRARTTINPASADLQKWWRMGASEATCNSHRQVMEMCNRSGIIASWSCIPHLLDNIPIIGQHCSWSESSALIYCNSMLGARTNRDGGEASLFSALLGITPNFGMHLDENRRGTHLIDVQCEVAGTSDWGTLGYFAGEVAGEDIPVFINLRRPTTEEAKQLGATINVPGGAAMFHIVGVTPEAPTVSAAFGGNVPVGRYVFDESAKQRIYESINHEPVGKVDLVFLGCPHCTLEEIKHISQLLEGKQVAKGTSLWIMTAYPIRASAERLGFAQTIEESGGELFADGCLLSYYNPLHIGHLDTQRPNLGRVATDSVKQALGARKGFGSKVFFGDTQSCVRAAVEGGV